MVLDHIEGKKKRQQQQRWGKKEETPPIRKKGIIFRKNQTWTKKGGQTLIQEPRCTRSGGYGEKELKKKYGDGNNN